jgi:RNA polymerase sigma-70 factor (ECF subfamily)
VANFSAHSSESLVQACVGHDNEAAWTEFVRRFQPLIAKVAGRTARRHWSQVPPHVVDDLVQETYLRLCVDRCRLLRQFQSRHQDSIYGFLKVVAASVVLDYFKGELALKRDAGQTDSLSDHRSPARPLTGNCSLLSTEDVVALRQIDGILGKLYTDEILIRNRAIFWLHYRDGMTAQAIASTPWISLKTKGVETALRRMTQLIQGHIGNIH